MSGEDEDVLIAEGQSLDADETVRSSVLKAIKDSKNFQEAIKKLVSVKKVYHEKIRKDVAKTGSLT
ncbi:hypothetical protein GO685_01545 [Wolbachia endosymbiont of Madathamugadia hiepei]|uniref:hypothetical protein n=1 Tax=Wolbachia endosymbiont of Madathamugadia hiepei TaxID=1241303 RepID=UPI0015895401|nr:hypothetical protein [Wolbachia endosymbiont of Madathamugadia hiepei]NUX01204.1 hypothetical protein [Wolbachia endosymbiont of Madathamugadia hiepei]